LKNDRTPAAPPACEADTSAESKNVSCRRFAFLLPIPFGLALVMFACGQQTDSASSDGTQTTSQSSSESKPGWTTSYEQGQQEAQANHKLMVLDFIGSDWCGWCKLLDREVFSQPQFKEYAKKNLVLVELDFPKRKRISDELRNQNLQLAVRYQVQGFPTIIVLDGEGQKVGELGYMEGGPAVYIAQLERLRKG